LLKGKLGGKIEADNTQHYPVKIIIREKKGFMNKKPDTLKIHLVTV
jgi:hypothetical protein